MESLRCHILVLANCPREKYTAAIRSKLHFAFEDKKPIILWKIENDLVDWEVLKTEDGMKTTPFARPPQDVKLYFYGQLEVDTNAATAGVALKPCQLDGDNVLENVKHVQLPWKVMAKHSDTINAHMICL